MSPKAEAEPKVERKAPPAGTVAKNTKLDVKPMKASKQEEFGDFEELVEFLRVCYFGKEGSAKTTNALTLANTGKILLVNAEGGAKKKALMRQGVDVTNIRFWPRPGETVTDAGLQRVFDTLKHDLERDPDSWNGIVFDSATDIVQSETKEVSDHRIAKARAKGAIIDSIDEFATDVGDFGTMAKMFTDKLRKFRELPLHVVYTALERRDVDKNSGEVTIGPAVTPGTATPLLGYVDIVIHCTAGDEEQPFRGLTKQGGMHRVKDRFGVLPRIMVEPTMDRILAYMNGEFDDVHDDLQDK